MIGRRTLTASVCALAIMRRGAAQPAPYPTAPIRLILPSAPGGVSDLVARVLADKVGAELGQPVVIENRSGGSTVIGTQAAARARPDGYTIPQVGAFGVVATVLQDRAPYNLATDFTPITKAGSFPMVLAVSGNSAIRSLADIVAVARSTDGGITYASGGAASMGHLTGARLVNELGITGTHVPYRGNSLAMQALVAGQVQFFFPAISDALQLARSGAVRLLGITTDRRVPILPNTPTMQELGMTDFSPQIWYGYVAPAATPPAIIERLREAYLRAAADPTVQERLSAVGFTIEVGAAETFGRFMQDEAVRWARVTRQNNITIND